MDRLIAVKRVTTVNRKKKKKKKKKKKRIANSVAPDAIVHYNESPRWRHIDSYLLVIDPHLSLERTAHSTQTMRMRRPFDF